MSEFYSETKKTSVRGDYDVIVVGGGPGGVAAALSAARHGMKVLIIEKQVILGGMATGGHVILYEPLCDGMGKKVLGGICEELLHVSIKYSYDCLPEKWRKQTDKPAIKTGPEDVWAGNMENRYGTVYNAPAFALALEEVVRAEDIEILYDTVFCDTVMEDGKCVAVIVENLTGRSAYRCKAVVDGSGLSSVFATTDTKTQNHPNNFTYICYDTDFEKMKLAMKYGTIRLAINWSGMGWNPFMPSDPNAKKYFGDTAEGQNEYILDSHTAALNLLKANQRPDYAMVSIASMSQLRMARHIVGSGQMTNINMFKPVANSVGCVSDWRKAGPIHEVPYDCTISPGVKNMFAVGRNISADVDMWDMMRCYPGCMTTGQAAGTAAALAIKGNGNAADVSIGALQQTLSDDGIVIHQDAL
jgi:hypothetical protein